MDRLDAANAESLRLATEQRKELKRQNKNLKFWLTSLVDCTSGFIAKLDEEMKKPSDAERGKRVANLMNALEIMKDQALHFGLGKPLKKTK